MEVINNIDKRLGDDLRSTMHRDAKVSIAAAYFSIYAYEALKTGMDLRDDLFVIVMTHSENTGDNLNPYHKIKTIGK